MLSLLLLLLRLSPQVVPRGPVGTQGWVLIGPAAPGGAAVPIGSIAYDRVTRVLYAGSTLFPAISRVFERRQAGGEWEEVRSPDLGGLFPYVKVTADPTAPNVVYAGGGTCMVHPPGCGGRLARSEDAGVSWTALLEQVTPVLAIDPFDNGLLMAVVDKAVPNSMFPEVGTIVDTSIRSGDGGLTWTEIPVPPGVFAFDPSRPGTVFAATELDGAWKSTDSGANWSQVNSGLVNLGTFGLSIDSVGVIHLATVSGVFVSSDGGEHWEPTGLSSMATSLVADPTSPGAAYAGGQSGVFRIDERGIPSPIGSGVSNVSDLAIDTEGLRLWAATLDGVFEYDIRKAPGRSAQR